MDGEGSQGERETEKTWKRAVLEENGNAAKHGARLGGLWASMSGGDASQMPYFLNGTEGCRLLLRKIREIFLRCSFIM